MVGVDIAPQPHYPFEFVLADAMTYPLNGFDAIWASPPCQGYSRTAYMPGRSASSAAYPQLIEPVRERLIANRVPWIIENVELAPLQNAIKLCGLMFGLHVYRHRLFEHSFTGLTAPPHPVHTRHVATGRLAHYSKDAEGMVTVAGHLFSLKAGSQAMGINWMNRHELAEAIPPAYSEYVGQALRRQLDT